MCICDNGESQSAFQQKISAKRLNIYRNNNTNAANFTKRFKIPTELIAMLFQMCVFIEMIIMLLKSFGTIILYLVKMHRNFHPRYGVFFFHKCKTLRLRYNKNKKIHYKSVFVFKPRTKSGNTIVIDVCIQWHWN
jgi:hypothetical protein